MSNVIVEVGIEQICNVCGIKLHRVKRLKKLGIFKYNFQRFGLRQLTKSIHEGKGKVLFLSGSNEYKP